MGEQRREHLWLGAGDGHDLVPRGGEQQDEPFPQQGVVLGDHHSHGSSASITVGPHVHGHSLHGSQQVMTAVGMGVVALGAGASLLRSRRPQQA